MYYLISNKESAVAGVSHAAKSKTYTQCLYWSILFMAGLVATIPALVGVINDYFTYPVTTRVTVKAADNATFPAVTVCGLNRFKLKLEFDYSHYA